MSEHPARVEPWVRWLCGDLPHDHPDAVKMIEAVKNGKRFKLPSHLKPAHILGVRTPSGCSDYEDDDDEDDYDDDEDEDDDGEDSKIGQNQASSSEKSANDPAPGQSVLSPEEREVVDELAKLFKSPGFFIRDLEGDYEAENYGCDNGMNYPVYDDDEEDSEEDEDDAVNRRWREIFTREEVALDLEYEADLRPAAYAQLSELEKQHGVGRVPLIHLDTYNVYCSEYMRHFCPDMEWNKFIEFHVPQNLSHYTDANGYPVDRKLERYEKLRGSLYFFRNVRHQFRELPYPEFASRDQVVKVTTEYGQHELGFKFLGGGYIEVEITRDTIVAALLEVGERLLQSKIQAAPEVFTFIGEQRTRY
ncbi:hypothetical protein QBC37DRAFT_382433 [Rhypophila decipiens]|uniref:Uncharacterized protein n=1 Tax=Rhypophila decipiens TaxID=261697 RepID=A0AAN6YI16_9PEZI|nr:hypothetical protein QBC37DRAFT_382433 [Rhypophila decipiens]